MQEVITSDKNNKVKFLRKMYDKKNRKKQGKYILEGYRITEEALRAGVDFDSLYFSPEFYKSETGCQFLNQLKNNNYSYNKRLHPILITSRLMANIADTSTPQGIIAVVNDVEYNVEDIFDNSEVILLIDRIQDPGNMGTMIRTAVAAGVDSLIILKGSVDIYNLKVLRATMGAIFNIKFIKDVNLNEFIDLYRQYASRYSLIATDLSADCYYDELDYRGQIIIAVGNEGNGLQQKILKEANKKIKVPVVGEIESINVAIAGGIVLYEVLRKKRINAN